MFKVGDIVKLIQPQHYTRCNSSTRLKVLATDGRFFKWSIVAHPTPLSIDKISSELPCEHWGLAEKSGLAKFVELQEGIK